MDQRASVMPDKKELIIFYLQPVVGGWVINSPQILIVLMCARGCREHSFYLNTTFALHYTT
jgi:hypothetical protein